MLVSETIRRSVAPVPPGPEAEEAAENARAFAHKVAEAFSANEDTIGPAIIFLGFLAS